MVLFTEYDLSHVTVRVAARSKQVVAGSLLAPLWLSNRQVIVGVCRHSVAVRRARARNVVGVRRKVMGHCCQVMGWCCSMGLCGEMTS